MQNGEDAEEDGGDDAPGDGGTVEPEDILSAGVVVAHGVGKFEEGG